MAHRQRRVNRPASFTAFRFRLALRSPLTAMPQAAPRKMNLLRHGRSPHPPLAVASGPPSPASGRGSVGITPRVIHVKKARFSQQRVPSRARGSTAVDFNTPNQVIHSEERRV